MGKWSGLQNRPDKRRERWMVNFERLVIEALPALAGKIEWDTAAYFYNQNLTSDEAAGRYIERRRGSA